MFALRTFSGLGRILFGMCLVGVVAGQSAPPAVQSPDPAQSSPLTPARNSVAFDALVDSAIRQERRLMDLMRNFKPIVETYIQEEKADSDLGSSPKGDDYFLSRLDLTGTAPATLGFEDPDTWKERWEPKLLKKRQPFAAVGFAQALFPDLGHFDRQNYTFEFVRWEVLGEVRCSVVDVKPRENAENRGFVGRIWIEDQDFNIVRFTGAHISKKLSNRAFHFDSWRLNTLNIMWTPAYVYTEESDPHDPSSHGLWFKAQTRIWGYDKANFGDHREYAKPLTRHASMG